MAAKTKFFLGAMSLVLGWHGGALADDRKQVCLDASGQGQTLRDEQKLLEAREQFRICSAEACPAVVRKDCEGWFEQAQADIPSIAFEPKDAEGKDVIHAMTTLDGIVIPPAQLDGRSIEVNPGPHVVRFELPDGTAAEQQALLHAGDKNHVVTAVLRHAELVATEATGGDVKAPRSSVSPLRTVGQVAAGAGVVTLALGGYFGLQAMARRGDADCPNNVCADDAHVRTLSQAHSAGTASTVLFATGGVVAGAGLALWIFAPHPSRSNTAQWQVTPVVGGGLAAMAVRGAW